jgi:hypothetical protein
MREERQVSGTPLSGGNPGAGHAIVLTILLGLLVGIGGFTFLYAKASRT